MADDRNATNVPGNPEGIAYLLLCDIIKNETKSLSKKEILDAYAECLKTVWAPDDRLNVSTPSQAVLPKDPESV